jgi:hypothetical protein
MPKKKAQKKAAQPLRILHPDVREAALRLAGGDRSRIVVVHRTEAVVR